MIHQYPSNTTFVMSIFHQYCINTTSILHQYVYNITRIQQCCVVLLLNTTFFNTAAILLQYHPNITSILHIVLQYYRNTTPIMGPIQHNCHFNTQNTHFNTTCGLILLNTTNTTQYYTQAQYYIAPILPNTTNTTNTTRSNLKMTYHCILMNLVS
jgi:hypothetical protein